MIKYDTNRIDDSRIPSHNNVMKSIRFSKTSSGYLDDLIRSAENYYFAYEIVLRNILDKFTTEMLEPAAFLSAHAAELYLKALIVYYKGDKGFPMTHELDELYKIVYECNHSSKVLKKAIEYLDKYSGTKMRYPSQNTSSKVYGTDETSLIRVIRDYVLSIIYPDEKS